MPFGSSGSVTNEGENILAEWDFSGGLGPAYNSILRRYGQMLDLGLENMRREQRQAPRAFSLWEEGKAEDLRSRRLAREGTESAMRQARLNARPRVPTRGTGPTMRQSVAQPQNVLYGGTTPNVSQASLLLSAPPLPPPSVLEVPGSAGGPAAPSVNIETLASPPPAAAYQALTGVSPTYVPFQAFNPPDFEAADIDTERKKKKNED